MKPFTLIAFGLTVISGAAGFPPDEQEQRFVIKNALEFAINVGKKEWQVLERYFREKAPADSFRDAKDHFEDSDPSISFRDAKDHFGDSVRRNFGETGEKDGETEEENRTSQKNNLLLDVKTEFEPFSDELEQHFANAEEDLNHSLRFYHNLRDKWAKWAEDLKEVEVTGFERF